MSMETDLRRHYNHALEYAESLKICSAQNGKSLYIWDIWIAHFTCGDGATKKENCMWPTEEQNLPRETMWNPQWPTMENLNVVVFWHNLAFTEIRLMVKPSFVL